MSWRKEVPADFRGEGNKIKYRALPHVRGLGLDIGCGPWKVFPHSIGIDGVAYAAHDNCGPNLVMNLEDLAGFSGFFADGAFDYIFSSHCLEHVRDPEQVLRAWWAKIKVGGRLILYLPHKSFYPNMGQEGANPDHKHDFMPADVVKIMRRVGGWTMIENEERGSEAFDYEYSFFQVYKKRDDQQHIDASAAPAKRGKTAAFVRSGNFGDAIWASSIAAHLKREGYHVTAYVENTGEAVLKGNPHIDRMVVMDRNVLPVGEWGRFFLHEKPRYDRWHNFIQSAEVELLKTPEQASFYWPPELRRKLCDHNYVELMHQVAGLDYRFEQRFYPTYEEREWAKAERATMPGRVVMLANAGSTVPKWWPYAPVLAQLLAEIGIRVLVVGDLKGLDYPEHPLVRVVKLSDWQIRQSLTFAQYVSAVVGQETGLLNAVALEEVPKVVLLSHSSATNLTRDWKNVRPLAGAVPCYPCHQIHYTHAACPQDEATKAAKCQAAIRVEDVMEALKDLGVVTAEELVKLAAPSQEAA